MHSTIQTNAYVVQTSRKVPHHSQALFDPAESFTVKSIHYPLPALQSTYKTDVSSAHTAALNPAYRNCWTTMTQRSKAHPPQMAQRSRTVIIQADPAYRRASDLLTPVRQSRSNQSAPPTAALPRTGQVKITPAYLQAHPSPQPDNSLENAREQKEQRNYKQEKGGFTPLVRRGKTTHNGPSFHVGNLTLADLQSAIELEFPETHGSAFNQACRQMRCTTATVTPREPTSAHTTTSPESTTPTHNQTQEDDDDKPAVQADRSTEDDGSRNENNQEIATPEKESQLMRQTSNKSQLSAEIVMIPSVD